MIENKENYKDNKEVFYMLEQLEIAIAKQDNFSVSVLTTRLANNGLKLKEINESISGTKSPNQKQRNSNDHGRTNSNGCSSKPTH